MSKKRSNQKTNEKKDWPVVFYRWAIGFGLIGYIIVGAAIFEPRPHPIHWLAGLIGGVLGIGIGWLWYRWRGDVF